MSPQYLFNIVIRHNAAFQLGLHWFNTNTINRKKKYLEIITFAPSMRLSKQKEESISI